MRKDYTTKLYLVVMKNKIPLLQLYLKRTGKQLAEIK